MGNEVKYDPVTGQPVTEELSSGQNVNSAFLAGFDPATGQPIQAVPQPVPQPAPQPAQFGNNFDPMTGQPINPQVQPQMQPQVQMQGQQLVPPINQTVGYQNMQGPQQFVPPIGMQPRYVEPKHPDETNPEAKKLFNASIICMIAGHLIPTLSSYALGAVDVNNYDTIGYIILGLGGSSYIAAIVLMIMLRVKYPKNKNGKILMIAMIAEMAIAIIGIIIIVAACMMLLEYFGCSG